MTKDLTVLELIDTWPATLEVMVRRGFEPLRVPALRSLLARNITVEQACALRGVDLAAVLAELDQVVGSPSRAGTDAASRRES